MSEITPQVIKDHGFTDEEYQKVLEIMGREPNMTELGIFSVMWSEHCSYKSSKVWLKTLPTEAPWVICGPGENAGVIDIGDGQACIFKMESHNHPSYIEPYQGATTGVGGILRDIFTMGARPVANLNALHFGEPDHPKTRHLVDGVVAGIAGYGNCMGIPTIGGECDFHSSYNGNILVNAFTAGVADTDKIFYSAATGAGNPLVYVGSKTGRDGIHGATMASAEFDENSDEKRPTVQVGDPFSEKLVLEACLELMATDCIVAIQDMGAAGLTCSTFEMASNGGVGLELDLDKVPQREENMTPYEMMLSESQERMVIVLRPGTEETARKIFEKWELEFAIIGTLTETGRMVLKHKGEVVGDLPIDPLAKASPEYERPWEETPKPAVIEASSVAAPNDLNDVMKTLIGTPVVASKRWIWEQYDHMVMGDTVQRPGGDAGVVRVHGTSKGLAMSSDCTPRYCEADPFEGGKQAVVETWRNITATGARPLAITDCMNFGNPQKPKIMGQFVGCIKGMTEACNVLEYPVVSGNVSFYNETQGEGIQPTPTIGGVGLMADVENMATADFKRGGESIVLIGETRGHLGASLYLREIEGREEGAPPPVDLAVEKRTGDFVRKQIEDGRIDTCHDIADGGLALAVAEMALAGGIGAVLDDAQDGLPLHAYLFGEDQARYLIATDEGDALVADAEAAGIPATIIGKTGGDGLTLGKSLSISLKEMKTIHEGWLPGLMAV